MSSPRLLGALVLLPAFLLGAGCNCTGGGPADAGTVTLTIHIEGGAGQALRQLPGGGTVQVCTSSSEPCAVPVVPGDDVTLIAAPESGNDFVSWACAGGQPSAAATLTLGRFTAQLACTLTFKRQVRQRLDVQVSDGRGGATGGMVTSTPAGIQCGTTGVACNLMVETGAHVTLTAVADPFYTFSGWGGDCGGQAASFEVVVPDNRTCVATFTRVRYPLSLNVTGQGELDATLPDGGALTACASPVCPAVQVDAPEVVGLAAVPGPNRRVASWTGDCAAAAAGLGSAVTMDAPRTCQLAVVLVDRFLTLGRGGTGAGTVAADPAGNQADGGTPAYPHGTVVKLTAAPDVNSDFTGWQGDCAGTAASTTVTLDADRTCTAVFTLKVRTLTVTTSTHGTVTSTPAGIDTARGVSSAGFPHGTSVQLVAAPEAHYEAVFSGACSATGQVTMVATAACGVTFRLVKQTLTATPVGSGSVTSVPAGIDTKVGKLAAAYDWGTTVTLTATPNTGGTQISFVGWSGDCSGTNPTVQVTLDASKSCTASFTVTPYDLTVAVTPTAGGSVTGRIGGAGANVITCGGGGTDCSELQIASDKTVTLVAAPAAGYRFDRWSGCASDTTATLVVPMTANKSCTAGFIKQWTVTLATLTGPGTVVLDRSSTGVGADVTCTAGPCSQLVDANETVTLTAVPGNGTTVLEAFTCSAGTRAGAVYTLVNPTADVTCSVTFHQRYTVAVSASGAGGSVASAPAGITACTSTGGTCSSLFLSGDAVVLTATPATNTQVTWTTTSGGVCDGASSAGAGQAQLMTFSSLGGDKACTAGFTPIQVTVNGLAGPNGAVAPLSTTVTSGGAGTVLTATPAASFHVLAWSGSFSAGTGTATGCAGSGATVTVAVSGATPGAVYDCTATFAVNTVTVNGRAGANGAVAPATTAGIAVGSPALTLTGTPAASYHLVSWAGAFTSGSGTATGCTGAAAAVAVAITSATDGAVYDCTATFAINTVTLNGRSGGNGTVAPATVVTTVGAAGVALGATPAANYHLTGWSGAFTTGSGTAAGCTGTAATVAVTVSAATDGAVYDCTATFAVNTATITGLAGANGTVAPASTPGVAVGSPATTLTATPAANYHVAAWSGAFTTGSGTATGCAGTGTTAAVTLTAASDGAVFACTATFALNTLTLNGRSGGNGTVAPATTAVSVGAAAVTLTATPATNFHLASWSGAFTSGSGTATGCSGSGPSVAVSVSAATDGAVYDCTATFAVNVVTVNGKAGANGTVTPASTFASSGGAGVGFTATPAANYHLVSWTGAFTSGSGTATGCAGNAAAVTVTFSGATQGASYDCTATFAINAVTVAGASGGNGAVAPAITPTTVGAGPVTLTATPAANYHLVSWSGAFTAGSGTATGCSGAALAVPVAVTSGSDGAVFTCTATFAINDVVVAGAWGGNGTVAPASTATTVGAAAVTLTATPAANNHLVSWSGAFTSGSGTATGCSGAALSVPVSVSAASQGAVYTCTATFAVNAVTVAGASGGNGAVAPASTLTTVGATAVTLTATPAASYHLVSWSGTFTAGSGTATGCSGNALTVAVAVTSGSDGAVFTCTATFAVNAVTVAGAAAGPGSVGPASTLTTVGAAAVTLTATPAANHHVAAWTGTFTAGSGTATGCAGNGLSVAVAVTSGTDGAVFTCTATLAINDVVVNGAAAGNGAVAPASTPTTVGAAAVTLTATPAANNHLVAWAGTFTSGSGTATGCSGATPSVAVSVSAASEGAVFTCTATFAVNTVTLNGVPAGPGTVAPGSTVVSVGAAALTLTATPGANAHLTGWSGAFTTGSGTASGCSGAGSSVAVSISSATDGAVYDCTATFAVNAVTVAGAPAGPGTVAPASTLTTVGAAAVTLTATPGANDHLVSWSGAFTAGSGTATGCAGSALTVPVTVTSGTDGAVYTCTATFAVNAVTVAGTSAGPGTVAPASTLTTVGAAAVTLTASPSASSHLVSWSGAFTAGSGTATGCAGSALTVPVAVTSGSDGAVFTCTATFAANAVTVTGASAGPGTVAPASTLTTVGAAAVTLTAAPSASAHLVSWSGAFTAGSGTATGCSGSAPTVPVAVTSGSDGAVYTCTATFAVNAVTVAGAATGPGTVAPASTATTVGAGAVTLTATPGASVHVVSWSGTFTAGSGTATGCSGSALTVPVAVTSGTDGAVYTCTATFAVNAVTLAGAAAGPGSVAPASTLTTVGAAAVTLTATPAANYHVLSWSGTFTAGSGTATGCAGNALSVPVAITSGTDGAVYACTATLAINTVTVAGAAAGSGSVAPASTVVNVGAAPVTLTATPDATTHLVSWSGAFTTGSGTATGCSGAGPSVAISISSATDGAVFDCTATFSINGVTVAGAPAGPGTVAPASTPTTVGAAAVTLTASPSPSAHLVSWAGAFTAGSGTAAGCGGAGTSVAVSVSTATDGAVYTCTATFAANAVTLTGTSGGNGTVAPPSTPTTVGGAAVTLTASPGSNYHLVSWSGAFTSGSGTPAGCSGAGPSVSVSFSAATDGAVYDCTATFALNSVTVAGASGGNGTVDPASTVVTVGGAAVTLTATADPSYHLTSWSGTFTSGSGTATGCSGTADTVAVAITGGGDGAVYTCTASFDLNLVTIDGVAGANGSVVPAAASVKVGAPASSFTSTPAASYHLAGWSGAFTTGSGTATGCGGAAASVGVTVTAGSKDAVYTCTASFAPNTVAVSGAAAGNGAVAPASGVATVGGAGVTLAATLGAGARVLSWSGAFTAGSGTATGCSGSGSSVTVTFSAATGGAAYTCTATFQQQARVTVQVVPAPAGGTSYGLVSSPCTVASGASGCSVVVDVGTSATLATAEATNAASQATSRFVRWVCSGGTTSTARAASVTITGDTTCVAQYFGLWSRYLAHDGSREAIAPEVGALAPGTSGGLPTSASTFVVEALDGPTDSPGLLGWLAADDQPVPALTDRAQLASGAAATRLTSSGDDTPGLVGHDTPSAGRTRGLSGGYLAGRTTAGVVGSLARAPFSEWYYPDPGGAQVIDTAFLGGRESADHLQAMGGYRALRTTVDLGQGPVVSTARQGLVVVADAAGNASAWGAFSFPATVHGAACSDAYTTTVRDVLWDPDPTNPGGVVVVGDYAEAAACIEGQPCPPDPATQHAYGFVAKLDASMRMLGMRGLAPGSGQPFAALTLVENLARTGYVVFGQYAGSQVGVVELSLDLGTVSLQLGLPVADPGNLQGGLAPTTFEDALVDRVGNRYLLLTSAVFVGAGSDVVVLSLDAAGSAIAGDGWRFGTPGLDETGHRLVQPSEGGFLFTGQGPLVSSGPRQAWVTRTNERFEVPFTGAAPGLVRSAAAPAAAVDLALAGGAFSCANGWVDLTRPSQAPLTSVPLAFSPLVTVQAP